MSAIFFLQKRLSSRPRFNRTEPKEKMTVLCQNCERHSICLAYRLAKKDRRLRKMLERLNRCELRTLG